MAGLVSRSDEIWIAGTGSFALEIVGYANAAGFTVAGLVELLDDRRVGRTIHDLPVAAIGSVADAAAVIGVGGDRLG
jgi:hypothetical protein